MHKYEYDFKAMWTTCSISIISENDNSLNELINKSYEQVISFENEFSRFKETSELNKLNKEKKLEIWDDFWFLINKSKEIFTLTDWYFNPLINLNKIWYSSNFETWNFNKSEINENLSFDDVKIYWNLLEIWDNMNLDFWSIAKWYLAEKISNILTEKWFNNNLVNMWWDIYASWTNLESENWKIAISDPFNPEESIDTIEITNTSISTSGTYLRNWEIAGNKYHHIRNPYSENQETELISATIIHEHWYFTDAIATAVIAMWKEKAVEFCKKNNIKFLFILSDWTIIKRL